MTAAPRVSALLAVVLSCALTACPPPPTPMPDAGEVDAGVTIGAVELCTRYADAWCELQVRCYPAYERTDRAHCVEQVNAQCLAATTNLQASFEAGRVTIDAARLSTCEKRLKTSACPPSFPPGYPLAVAQPFGDCSLGSGLLTGGVKLGETCDDPVECPVGTFCVKPGGVCRGTCVAFSKLDEPCGISCEPGLRCDGNKCTWLKGLDEPCNGSAECESDLICLGSCRPRRKLGESCRVDYDRLSPCEPGLACDVVPFVDGLEGTCIVPRNEFEPCAYHWSCRAGLVCADLDWTPFPAAAPSRPGNCRQPDGADFNCHASAYSAFIGDQCAPGLSCNEVANKCQALPERGQSCTPSRANCAGFEVYCKPTGSGDVGVCAGAAVQGDRCATKLSDGKIVQVPCATGFCETEVTMQCRPPSKPTGSLCKQDGECISGRCVPQADQTLKCAPPC